MAARNAYFPLFIILNRWKIRGRPFDSDGGGGGLANFVGTDYLFPSRAGPDYLFSGIPRTPKKILIKLLQNHVHIDIMSQQLRGMDCPYSMILILIGLK